MKINYDFKLSQWVLVFILAAVIGSCDKTESGPEGKMELVFTPRFGAETFNTLQPYAYGDIQSIKLSKFDFYITGISLISASGNTLLEDAGLIDITGSSASSATLSLDGIKTGNYTGIKFSIGVIPELNAKDPKDFKSANPLSSTSHYWEAWDSYIFSKIEGVLDTGGAKTYDLGFAIHTGTDECLATLTVTKNFTISEEQTTGLGLDLDVRRVFQENGQFFNLPNSPLNHNPANIGVLKLFASNLAQAIQIKN
ncbi:MAG TPA: hypothetical protein PKM27_17500 [Saprospiraceae bacterium]|nr:hypothetical protein [Saprospiraceae bacterium]HNT21645.1 hypothetical protein [Saprospiraceae bacterium]